MAAMTLIRVILFILCIAVATLLAVAIGYDVFTHTGRDSGALSGKAVVELVLVGAISLMFFRWSRDLWLKLRSR
jgi:hypothetical protein